MTISLVGNFKSTFNSGHPFLDVSAKDLYIPVRHIKLPEYVFPMGHFRQYSHSSFICFRLLFYANFFCSSPFYRVNRYSQL